MTTLQIGASLYEDSRGVIYAPRVFNYTPREHLLYMRKSEKLECSITLGTTPPAYYYHL